MPRVLYLERELGGLLLMESGLDFSCLLYFYADLHSRLCSIIKTMLSFACSVNNLLTRGSSYRTATPSVYP